MEFETVEGLITINATLFLQIIQFLIFMVIMDKIMFRPARDMLKDRKETFSSKEREINEFLEKAHSLKEELQKMESDARARAALVRTKEKERAMAEADKILKESRQKADSIRAEANKKIQDALARAKEELKGQVEELSDQIMAKIVVGG